MRFGNMARTLRDIPTPALVSVVIPKVLIACQEGRRVVLRVKSTYVTTHHNHEYCHLALDWRHSFCTQGLSPRLDSILLDKSFGSNLKD